MCTQLCLNLWTLWTVAQQTSLSMGISEARILEGVAISFFRVSYQPRDWISSPLAGGFFFLNTEPLEKPHWHKDPHVIKQNRKESPEVNPWIYSQVIFHKCVKYTQYGKDSLLNKYHGENCLSTCRRIQPLFYTIHKNQLKKKKT